jgi:hypothetical protein
MMKMDDNRLLITFGLNKEAFMTLIGGGLIYLVSEDVALQFDMGTVDLGMRELLQCIENRTMDSNACCHIENFRTKIIYKGERDEPEYHDD